MIRTVIIDDETHCVKTLSWQIEKLKLPIEIVKTANNGSRGIDIIHDLHPELVFLDIEMPKMNGFDMLKQLNNVDFKIIFTTAYDEYAIQAFRVSALDYLLKPIRNDQLSEAVNRVEQSMQTSARQLDVLMENIGLTSPIKQKIALPSMEGLDFVHIEDIVYCEAVRNYTKIVMKNEKVSLVSKTLKDIEAILAQFQFFRSHKSYLVNLQYVVRYVRGDGGYAIMSDGSAINISRNKKDDFLKVFSRI